MSMENFIVLTVVIVMSMVLSFSYGVERGKKGDGVSSPVAVTARSDAATRPARDRVVAKSEAVETKGKNAAGKLSAAPTATTVKAMAEDPDAPVATRTAAKAPEKIVDKFYTVQVASYKKGDYAAKAAQGLQQKGHEAIVVNKGEYDIVCVGRFAAEEEAKKFSRKLKKQYKDCLVRRM